MLYAFIFNKSDAYLLNIEPSNLVLLKFQNTKFDELSQNLDIKIADYQK